MNGEEEEAAPPYPEPAGAWQSAAELLATFLHQTPLDDLGTILIYAHMAVHGVLPNALASMVDGAWAAMIYDRARFLKALRGSTTPDRAVEIESTSRPGEASVYIFGLNYHAVGTMQWTPLSAGGDA